MALLSIHIVLSLFLSVLLLFYFLSFASMAVLSIRIILSLFLSVLLLVPYQAQSRSITKTDSDLPLLEEEEVTAGKEEEAQQHRRLLEYPCLTPDPALPFLYHPPLFNSSALHGRDLADFLRRDRPAIWGRHRRHDHFLVLARPAWDFSQHPDADPPLWGTSFLCLPDFLNVTVLSLEAHPWPWQERAVPHPTSFHPATLARTRHAHRTNLMLFAGGGGGGRPYIRGSIRAECQNRTDICVVVDCSEGACNHDPIRFMRPMLRSTFCLQPPGDTPTRWSTFDGILAGCIPVFFEEIGARAQYG